MMYRSLVAGAALALAAADSLGDSSAFVQSQAKVNPAEVLQIVAKKASEMDWQQGGIEVLAFSTAKDLTKKVMDDGAERVRDQIRKKTPFGLGSVFLNDKSVVQACGDISSSVLCHSSEKIYNITCLGWGGSCLAPGADCQGITSREVCKNSKARLGMTCLGWGGNRCLPPNGSTAELITDETVCRHAKETLGIQTVGWSGSTCLDSSTVACQKITSPSVCRDASRLLGLECAGWGGSACIDKTTAACDAITEKRICAESFIKLNLTCAGWGGSHCMDKRTAACEQISQPGICSDASRLGLRCAGWGGSSCIAASEKSESICAKVTSKRICKSAKERLGVGCSWTEGACIRKAASASEKSKKN